MKLSSLVYGATALAITARSQNSTFCTPDPAVCYAINVPASTASNPTGNGTIFLQITGPSSMSWIGFGQGTQMAGSNIFVIYADTSGTNVTLSPRLGTGEVMPMMDKTANVSLLGGSGIARGMMTANIMCTNCNSWMGGSMSFADPASTWIWAHLPGPPLSTNDPSAPILQHSIMGTATLNLVTAASLPSSSSFMDPFGTNISTTSTPNTIGSSMATTTVPSPSILKAHGIMASAAFVVLFPLGAIGMRVVSFGGLVWVHAGYMMGVYAIVFGGLGIGIWIAVVGDMIGSTHAIVGLVVMGSLVLQPVTGLIHHALYKRRGEPDFAENVHVWWGRAVVVLGIINGGLGLQLAANTTRGEMAYGIVGGIMGLIWIVVIFIVWVNNRGVIKSELGETGKKVYRNRRMMEKELNGGVGLGSGSHSEANMRGRAV